MNTWPAIDMAATGINIVRMRQNAGLTVKDLQDIFGFSTPQAIYNRGGIPGRAARGIYRDGGV